MSKKWTQERIIDELKSIYATGQRISFRLLYDSRRSFTEAIVREFGSLDSAVMSSGIDPFSFSRKNNKSKDWTNEFVLSEIKRLEAEGVPINSNSVAKSYPALQFNARKIFGNYDTALLTAGFDPDKIRGRAKKRGREGTITEIKKIAKRGDPLNSSFNETHNENIWSSAGFYFGGWYQALDAAGFCADDHRKHGTEESFYGREFQELFKEVMDACGSYRCYNESYENDKNCIPDFIIDESTWLDAKLSSWTVFNSKCETVDKYLKHCKKLLIVYLRGHPLIHRNSNVELIPVDFYFEKLRNIGRGDLISRIEQMKSDVALIPA